MEITIFVVIIMDEFDSTYWMEYTMYMTPKPHLKYHIDELPYIKELDWPQPEFFDKVGLRSSDTANVYLVSTNVKFTTPELKMMLLLYNGILEISIKWLAA